MQWAISRIAATLGAVDSGALNHRRAITISVASPLLAPLGRQRIAPGTLS